MADRIILDPSELRGRPYQLTSWDFSTTWEVDPSTAALTVMEMKQLREHLPRVVESLSGRTFSDTERTMVAEAFDAVEHRDHVVTLDALLAEVSRR